MRIDGVKSRDKRLLVGNQNREIGRYEMKREEVGKNDKG